jgi:hypothetical protein
VLDAGGAAMCLHVCCDAGNLHGYVLSKAKSKFNFGMDSQCVECEVNKYQSAYVAVAVQCV